MSALKLKPLEDSNLYKRRTTSKENLLLQGGNGTVDMGSTGGEHSNPANSSLLGGSYAMQTQPSSSGAQRQHHHHLQPTTLPPPMQPMHVSYPHRPQTAQLAEGYYQQPRSPIRASPAPGGGVIGGALTTQLRPTHTTNTTSIAHKYPYDSNPTPMQQRNNASTGRPHHQQQYQNVSGVAERRENGATVQQPSAYQNLPANPSSSTLLAASSTPPPPVTPGRRMESWEQFGRSNVQTVTGLVEMLSGEDKRSATLLFAAEKQVPTG